MSEDFIVSGYIIVDSDGRVQLHTLRSNRAECWKAFCKPEMKKTWQQRGFRCAQVFVSEIKAR